MRRTDTAPRGLAGPLEWECSSDATEPMPMSLADALFGFGLAVICLVAFGGIAC